MDMNAEQLLNQERGERLRQAVDEARIQYNLLPVKIAEYLKEHEGIDEKPVTPQTVNGWFNRGTIKRKYLRAIAGLTNKSVVWLDEGGEQLSIQEDQPGYGVTQFPINDAQLMASIMDKIDLVCESQGLFFDNRLKAKIIVQWMQDEREGYHYTAKEIIEKLTQQE